MSRSCGFSEMTGQPPINGIRDQSNDSDDGAPTNSNEGQDSEKKSREPRSTKTSIEKEGALRKLCVIPSKHFLCLKTEPSPFRSWKSPPFSAGSFGTEPSALFSEILMKVSPLDTIFIL